MAYLLHLTFFFPQTKKTKTNKSQPVDQVATDKILLFKDICKNVACKHNSCIKNI